MLIPPQGLPGLKAGKGIRVRVSQRLRSGYKGWGLIEATEGYKGRGLRQEQERIPGPAWSQGEGLEGGLRETWTPEQSWPSEVIGRDEHVSTS